MKDTVMVFGQMNDGGGAQRGLTADYAEYFAKAGATCCFIDNIFRFDFA
jgi:F0F1-type ATP synthase beta subunit